MLAKPPIRMINKKMHIMEDLNVFNQFQKLASFETNSGIYNVIDIPNVKHKLGRSSEGFPIFFVITNNTITIPNIEREFLRVEFDIPCSICLSGKEIQKNNFSIITLCSNDMSLQEYFINIFNMILRKISSHPSNKELSIEVECLISIFTSLSKPARKKAQGLWAELLVIEKSLNPETLVASWHRQSNAKYDFTMGRDKIEVKSTSTGERVHHFSLDQLNPSPNSRLLIASIIVRESAPDVNGLSIKDLYDKICVRLTNNELRLRLYSIIMETIGRDYKNINNMYFDYTEASDSIAFFSCQDIPKIDKGTIQPLISDVQFTSNLTHLEDIRYSDKMFETSDSLLFCSLFKYSDNANRKN